MSVPPLTAALGIPGAHAVSLLDPDGPRVLWWAGETAPSEQEAAAAVTLAAAAAGLVLLGGDGADELGDILLTSADAFHVVRLVDDEAPLVAHLTLRRAGANLAMARREFGALVRASAGQVVPGSPGHPPTLSTFDLGGALTARSDPSRPPVVDPAVVDPAVAGLPRRHRRDPPETDESSDLLSLLGRPYATDDTILDRVLVVLRHL